MPDLHVKIEDDNGKLEVTVDKFDTRATTADSVTIYNDANAGGISFRVYFPGVSALATNPFDVRAAYNVTVDVSAGEGYYAYIISATLSGGTASRRRSMMAIVSRTTRGSSSSEGCCRNSADGKVPPEEVLNPNAPARPTVGADRYQAAPGPLLRYPRTS